MTNLNLSFKVFVTLLLIAFSLGISAQTHFRFDVQNTPWLSIIENSDGFIRYHQNNSTHTGLNHTSIFFGFDSGKNTINDPMVFLSGSGNSAFGFSSLVSNTSGFLNTAVGFQTLEKNTTGNGNVSIGAFASKDNISGRDNVAIGNKNSVENIGGVLNVSIGLESLYSNKNGNYNVSIGATAGINDSASNKNVYIGWGAGRGTIFTTPGYDREENVMMGALSGYQNQTSGNVFLGYRSGYYAGIDDQLYIENSDGDSTQALIYGDFSTDFLRINGEVNIDGNYSLPTTAPSNNQLLKHTSGGNLSWINETWRFNGANEVYNNTTNIGIGSSNPDYRFHVEADAPNNFVAAIHNTNASAGDDGLEIMCGSKTTNATANDVFISFIQPSTGIQYGAIVGDGSGGIAYNTTSDRRLKTNIEDYKDGLSLVKKLQPRSYERKSSLGKKEIGFIAQELNDVLPQVVSVPSDHQQVMMVDYGRMTPVLVSAIQEQNQAIERLLKMVDEQQKTIEKMKQDVLTMQNTMVKN